MPPTLLGPSPDVPLLLLEALWAGIAATPEQQQAAGPAARARTQLPAAAEAYQECLAWLLGQAPRLAAPGGLPPPAAAAAAAAADEPAASAYCKSLVQGSLTRHVMPLVTGQQQQSKAESAGQRLQEAVALQLAVAVTGKLLLAADASALPALVSELEASVSDAADAVSGCAAGIGEDVVDDGGRPEDDEGRLLAFLTALRAAPPSQPALGAALAARRAAAAGSRLFAALGRGGGQGAASSAPRLLSSLVQRFGASVVVSTPSSPTDSGSSEPPCPIPDANAGLLHLFISGPASGPAASAFADLLASLLLQDKSPEGGAKAWGDAFQAVSGGRLTWPGREMGKCLVLFSLGRSSSRCSSFLTKLTFRRG